MNLPPSRFAITSTQVLVRGRHRLRDHHMLVRLHLLNVARTTHEPPLVRIASLVRFISQLHATLFADVAIHMKVFIH